MVEKCKNVTFYAKTGSYAEKYLKANGFVVKDYVSVTYNDNQVYSDQPAVISGGRTMVPIRAVAEAFGCNVGWDNNTRTAIISE